MDGEVENVEGREKIYHWIIGHLPFTLLCRFDRNDNDNANNEMGVPQRERADPSPLWLCSPFLFSGSSTNTLATQSIRPLIPRRSS
jgi:hypothetical protein